MTRPRTTRAQHAVDIVEASYQLDGSDPEWLSRILAHAQQDLDLGLGCYAFTCRVAGGSIEVGPVYVERELDPRFGALIAQLNREAPEEINRILARTASVSGGFQQFLGPEHPGVKQLHSLGRGLGIVDAFSLFAQDGEGHGIDFTAPSDVLVEAHPRVRGIWQRVGLHVAAAWRLRRRLGAQRAQVEALLSPAGKLEHAEGALRDDATAHAALTRAVRAMEQARTTAQRRDADRALSLWRGLVQGAWSLVDRWESDGRRYIAAYQNRPGLPDPRALTPLERAVLGYAALGSSNKEIAFSLGLSMGSVGEAVGNLLAKLRCRRRSDLLLFADPSQAEHLRVELEGEALEVLSLPVRMNPELESKLSAAEREVAAQVIAGQSDAEIARARGTSPRTVANQLRRVFGKLGVHSRTELVRVLTG